jgi:hypothetical protein
VCHDAAGAEEVGAGEAPRDGHGARVAALAAGARSRLKVHGAGHGRLDEAGDAEVAQETADALVATNTGRYECTG